MPTLTNIALMSPDWSWWRFGTPKPRTLPVHEILFVITGELPICFAGVWQQLKPSQGVAVRSGTPRATRCSGREDLTFFVLQWQGDFPPLSSPHTIDDRSGRCQLLLNWLLDLSHHGAGAVERRMRGHLLNTLLLDLQPRPTPPVDDPLLRVRRFLDDHFHRPISLIDTLPYSGVSKDRTIRLFRARFGTTPHQYLLTKRVDAAVRLLRASRLPLPTIALQTGFSSVLHLGRAVRRSTGRHLRAWRQAGSTPPV